MNGIIGDAILRAGKLARIQRIMDDDNDGGYAKAFLTGGLGGMLYKKVTSNSKPAQPKPAQPKPPKPAQHTQQPQKPAQPKPPKPAQPTQAQDDFYDFYW